MFGHSIEDEFINAGSSATTRTRRDRNGTRLLVIIAAGLIAFGLWASTHELQIVTRGLGRVIPSSRSQVVQSLEGGIVRDILVREGDLVEKSQVLMQVDDTGFASKLGELVEQEGALLAEKARLETEAQFGGAVTFPDGLTERMPLATAAEVELFVSRRRQLDWELAILTSQLAQKRGELAEQEALQKKNETVLAPLREEIALTEELRRSGAVPQIEFLRLASREAELEGEMLVGEARLQRLAASIEQAENELAAARTVYILSARQRLAQLQVELAVVQEALRAASDKVLRTQLRAPVRGTINSLPVTTIGAVIQPGQPVAEIVPADEGLLIEVDVLPNDVAFISPGAEASVKITAYDYLVYGNLDGKVERIGADTITNTEGDELFRVVVRADRTYLGTEETPLPISPGMIAQVDIRTGNRTVLDYLMKPLLRARFEALRER